MASARSRILCAGLCVPMSSSTGAACHTAPTAPFRPFPGPARLPPSLAACPRRRQMVAQRGRRTQPELPSKSRPPGFQGLPKVARRSRRGRGTLCGRREGLGDGMSRLHRTPLSEVCSTLCSVSRWRSRSPAAAGSKPAAVDPLLHLLADVSPQVRTSALSSLGFLRQPRTLRKIRSLAKDDNPRVRAWVAIALGRFHALESADPVSSAVLDQLAADTDPYVRDQATEARRRTRASPS
ncbi:HEAT repeat domain-containing protein [Streptomyces sp. NPDC085612]|uniref:HEAT repeat domain-containing protein n=1 Tax=Streptomyces sp. NPDC085612 TaxID=3365732 RepID=UPI0037D706DF